METVHRMADNNEKVQHLRLIASDLRDKLNECKCQVLQLNSLQDEFQLRIGRLFQQIAFSSSMDQENDGKPVPKCSVSFADCQTQTADHTSPPRRWNSDMSLDIDLKMNKIRYQEDALMFASSETTVPVIRTSLVHQKKSQSTRSKFTKRLDFPPCKRPSDNFLLSDLGFTSQAPEFSQSEFNLNREEPWLKENSKGSGGRVRFLSHDDGQAGLKIPNSDQAQLEMNSYLHRDDSWATLTHSERDFSELDSTFSLNYQQDGLLSAGRGQVEAALKPVTSTPKAFQSRLKQSVSFNGKAWSSFCCILEFLSFVSIN